MNINVDSFGAQCPKCGANILVIKLIETGKVIFLDPQTIEERVVIRSSLKLFVDSDGKELYRGSMEMSARVHECSGGLNE